MDNATTASDSAGQAEQSHLAQVARSHWLGRAPASRVQANVVKSDLWDYLDKEKLNSALLHELESLQCFELYLWPSWNGDASHHHALLLVLLLNAKRREGLPNWTLLADRPAELVSFFHRIRSLVLDTDHAISIRTQVLSCIVGAFQSLDVGLIRKECAPLVAVGIWEHLHDETVRGRLIEAHPQFKKAWRAAAKRYEAADSATKSRLRYERAWLYELLLDFLDILYNKTRQEADALLYCERFLEFLTDLLSQFPTRRYTRTLLGDLNILVAVKLSPLFSLDDAGLFRDLWGLLVHYADFPIDDQTSRQLTEAEVVERHSAHVARFQRIAIKDYKEQLRLLALSNYGALTDRQELLSHVEPLGDDTLVELVISLGHRTAYKKVQSLQMTRAFLLEVLAFNYEKRPSVQQVIKNLSILPTERLLYDSTLLRSESYDGLRPVALPKLNLSYLTTDDFLHRSFVLSRYEYFYEIRTHLEESLKRLQPKGQDRPMFSRMAFRTLDFAIVNSIPAKVGERAPAQVKAEAVLDVHRTPDDVRREWEELRPDDTVFLLCAKQSTNSQRMTNGNPEGPSLDSAPFTCLRAAEIIQVQDENNKPIRFNQQSDDAQYRRRPRTRKLVVKLDTAAYAQDMLQKEKGRPDVYESINMVVRRKGRENNFKPVLESIRALALSDAPLPLWLQDVFLGLGDPSSASYHALASALASLDFRDTFLSWQHLQESFPGRDVKTDAALEDLTKPPYVLEFSEGSGAMEQPGGTKKSRQNEAGASRGTKSQQSKESEAQTSGGKGARTARKRRRDELEDGHEVETVTVSTYKPPNEGPYPSDRPLQNRVRFTPTQVDAITSGTQPGLTLVVGPPGTGKTDVTTQIINNIYHNFSSERILLVAHSNQALNQLFEKIAALDIDQRHLLRLGQGEKDLQLGSDSSYGNHGRVDYFLQKGAHLLAEVHRLATSINAPGAHGSSCETAGYFNQVYIQPAWQGFVEQVAASDDTADLLRAFPFQRFFDDAPQPLFPKDATRESIVEIAKGCYRHIEKTFIELEDIRPFEVLRRDREKANYLFVKEARVIAMTTTYAGMRQQEIAKLGFHYDSLIMEEAAQVTEIDAFVPMALQKVSAHPKQAHLKRVVLVGDHLQNSPIVQNTAVRQYSNFEQSLFQRLIRLGVPSIQLDAQGRARSSLAGLYAFRYPNLRNLPHVESLPEFTQANAGLRWDYQFIDVPDYKGKGETVPSPHFRQNLGEAEYVVAMYMYMRLLGYAGRRITILTMYAGQRALIRDVLGHRCAKNPLFGMPRMVSTVDKYQGEQNDFVLLSLVRTRSAGYMRDTRRLTVALSRARLGLYIFGRRAVFEENAELAVAFEKPLARPSKLQLVTDEMFPTTRGVVDDVAATDMEGVEHLGQYVFEMTKAKAQALRENGGQLPEPEPEAAQDDDDDAPVEPDDFDGELGDEEAAEG